MKIHLVALTTLTLFAPVSGFAQKSAPTRKVQASAEAVKILDRYILVTGGTAAYAKIKSTQVEGQMKMEAVGMSGEFTMLTKEPNKFLMTQKMANVGESRAGYDGKVGWSKDPLSGFRFLKGKELLDMQLQSDLGATVKWDKLYKKIELKGKQTIAGSPAYKLVMTPKSGNNVTQYYDVASGLLVRMDTLSQTPQGTFNIEMYFSDYTPIDGVKTPYTVKMKMVTFDILMKIVSVKNNVSIPNSKFAPPKQ